MRKKLFFGLLLIFGLFAIAGCNSNNKLNEIAKKINNCESVKNYKEFGYELKASSSSDTLTVTTNMNDEKTKVEFKLTENILSNENLSVNDLMSALLVINGVGQTYGYKDGELSQNVNTFPNEFEKYTLDNEGMELVIGDENVSLKIDVSKKVPLIDMNKFYLKTDDFDMISELVKENESGNQSGKTGNIAYDVFVSEDENTIEIGQDGKLADSAYKSILSALEVLYGSDTVKKFQELYPEFKDGKLTLEAFTIEKNYKPEDKGESMFKDTEIVLITIDNKKILED